MLQFLLGDIGQLLRFQAGKAGGVGNAAAAAFKDLHLAGGMAPAAQLLADVAGLAVQVRVQGVEQGRFAHPRIAAESAQPALDSLAQGIEPFPCGVVEEDDRNAAFLIGGQQLVSRCQVRLGDDQNRLDILIDGRRGQFIQYAGAGHRLGRAGHDEQHIQVGDGRPHEHILAGGDLVDHVTLGVQGHNVPGHRRNAPLAEDPAGAAFLQAGFGADIIETAHALCDVTGHPVYTLPSSLWVTPSPVRYRRTQLPLPSGTSSYHS